MADKDDLTKRILKTKKESEELEAQLQRLIELGKSQSYYNSNPIKHEGETTTNKNKVQIIKSYDSNYSKHIDKPIPSKSCDKKISSSNSNTNIEPPKKLKNYDVNEAREYMKKQKEKRLKEHKPVNEAEPDIRKKRLEELRKKSRELVSRNVQLNRARSKSRERHEYVRIDDTNKKVTTGYENDTVEVNRPKKINIISNITLNPAENSKQPTSKLLHSPEKESDSTPVIHKTATQNTERTHASSSTLQSQVDSKLDLVQNFISKCNVESREESQINKNENFDENYCDKEINVSNFKKEFPDWLKEPPAQAYPFNFINTVKRKLQFVVNSPKPTVDVGIQSTYLENVEVDSRLASHHSKKCKIVDSNKVSNLKSFKSHHYDNLDAKAIEHLELIKTKNRLYSDIVPSLVPREFKEEIKTVFNIAETESESDTSKNIPDISSESGSSLQNNAESIRRNLSLDFELINAEKIKDLKLIQPTTNKSITSRSDRKYSPTCQRSKILDNKYLKVPQYSPLKTVSDHYESDFESDLKESINRSRESIVSFNSPEFSKQIIKSPPPPPQLAKISPKNNLLINNFSVKSEISTAPPSSINQNLNYLNNGSQNDSTSSNSEIPPSSIISTNFDVSKHAKSNTSKSISSVLPKSSKNDEVTEIIPSQDVIFMSSKESTIETNVNNTRVLKSKNNDISNGTLHNGNVGNNLATALSNSTSTNLGNSNISTAQSNSGIESSTSVASKSQNITSRQYKNIGDTEKTFDIPPLKDPDLYLIKNINKNYEQTDALLKNVSIRSRTKEDNMDSVSNNVLFLTIRKNLKDIVLYCTVE